jgi:hypothetical protein
MPLRTFTIIVNLGPQKRGIQDERPNSRHMETGIRFNFKG